MPAFRISQRLGLAALTALLLAACGGNSAANSPTTSGEPQAGRQIYQSGKGAAIPCATCHTLDGAELVGPTFQGISERAGERVPALSTEEYIRQSITDPAKYIVEGYTDTMPKNYSEELNEDDMENLIVFLLNQ